MRSYAQIFAIKKRNRERILACNPNIPETSGIYIFTRYDGGFKYAYVGQAKNLLERLADHLNGYNQHIDLSLKTHKLYSNENKNGWQIQTFKYPLEQLNEMEQYYIEKMANLGYQLRNKTSGSQGKGKQGIAPNKERKGFKQGLEQGYEKCQKEVIVMFEKYLDFVIKGKPNKTKEKQFEKFKYFLEGKK